MTWSEFGLIWGDYTEEKCLNKCHTQWVFRNVFISIHSQSMLIHNNLIYYGVAYSYNDIRPIKLNWILLWKNKVNFIVPMDSARTISPEIWCHTTLLQAFQSPNIDGMIWRGSSNEKLKLKYLHMCHSV